jgi:hypothetical protein
VKEVAGMSRRPEVFPLRRSVWVVPSATLAPLRGMIQRFLLLLKEKLLPRTVPSGSMTTCSSVKSSATSVPPKDASVISTAPPIASTLNWRSGTRTPGASLESGLLGPFETTSRRPSVGTLSGSTTGERAQAALRSSKIQPGDGPPARARPRENEVGGVAAGAPESTWTPSR